MTTRHTETKFVFPHRSQRNRNASYRTKLLFPSIERTDFCHTQRFIADHPMFLLHSTKSDWRLVGWLVHSESGVELVPHTFANSLEKIPCRFKINALAAREASLGLHSLGETRGHRPDSSSLCRSLRRSYCTCSLTV